MQETLKIVDGTVTGTKLPQFLTNSNLKPFIFKDKDPAQFEKKYHDDGQLDIDF